MIQGTVKLLKPGKGWGAVSSPELPDGADAWVHFSAIDMPAFRELTAGDRIEFTYEEARQDSFRFRATPGRKP